MKKKVPLKNMVWKGGVTRRFLLEGGIDFNGEKRVWQERGGENTDGV